MQVFEFVIIIVALGILAGMFKSWLKHKEKHAKPDTSQSDARIDKLEARVQVLERIITDKAEKLKDDIDSL